MFMVWITQQQTSSIVVESSVRLSEIISDAQIDLTSVVGESWQKICSTLIFTASDTKPLSRNTTRSGSSFASSFTRSSVTPLSKQATRALSSTKNTVLPCTVSRRI